MLRHMVPGKPHRPRLATNRRQEEETTTGSGSSKAKRSMDNRAGVRLFCAYHNAASRAALRVRSGKAAYRFSIISDGVNQAGRCVVVALLKAAISATS